MNKIVVIGDTHGHNTWKTIVESETFDKVIFLGDYFDTFANISSEEQNENFLNIVKYCKQVGNDKCILLLGNHDYHYINWSESYSGKQQHAQMMFYTSLMSAIEDKLLKIVHVENNIIFSHAGITEYWLTKVAKLENPEDINTNKFRLNDLSWNCFIGFSPYGNTISNSPIWVRPNSLQKDALKGYTQVVGHTHVKSITNFMSDNSDKIFLCDCLPQAYLVIEDGEFLTRKLNDSLYE